MFIDFRFVVCDEAVGDGRGFASFPGFKPSTCPVGIVMTVLGFTPTVESDFNE